MKLLKRCLILFVSWLAATLGAAVVGTVFQAQTLIARLDVPTSLSARLSQTGYDITHFAPLYAIFIGVGFLVAFLVAFLLRQIFKLDGTRVGDWIFVLAGVVSMWVMLWAMENVMFGLPAIAGARFAGGMILQLIAGGLAGGVFAFLIRRGNLRRGEYSSPELA